MEVQYILADNELYTINCISGVKIVTEKENREADLKEIVNLCWFLKV